MAQQMHVTIIVYVTIHSDMVMIQEAMLKARG